MKITFWGVRGSTPVSGADYIRYGGATSCVTVSGEHEVLPSLVLDAGTGLVNLARAFGPQAFDGSILLTHVHWDHVHGLPFFGPADQEAARVQVQLPVDEVTDLGAEQVLGGIMTPPFFPIRPSDLRGAWTFGAVCCGEPFEAGGASIVAHELPHKGGRTVGYRVTDGTATMAYMPDHRPTAFGPGEDGFGEYHEAALALAADVDVLVHGAPFLAEELTTADRFGHTTIPYALGLAARAGATRLVITHHAPLRTDVQLDALAEIALASELAVQFAFEGLIVSTADHCRAACSD